MIIRGVLVEYIGQYFCNEEVIIFVGDEVEGDYIGQMAFIVDGVYVFVFYWQINNIFVIEWEIGVFVVDILVGGSLIEIIVMDMMVVVFCFISNEVYLINLNDFSVVVVIFIGVQFIKVCISWDGSIVVVVCDEVDVLEVIDLVIFIK